jgi:hypothetical protein
VLPTQSVCLVVPVLRADEYDDPVARRLRRRAERFRGQPRGEPAMADQSGG